MKNQAHGNYDSHPALKIRIEYAKKFENRGEKDTNPVGGLFDNWDEINAKVADLYNVRLIHMLHAYGAQAKTEAEKKENK